MTEKRFTITGHRSISDHQEKRLYDLNDFDGMISVTECLNELTCKLKRTERGRTELAEFNVQLMEENNELKEQLKDCQQKKQNIKDVLMNSEPVVEQKKLQKLIYRSVNNLIDEKIKELKNINNVSIIPRESIEVLEQLKKELLE